MRDFAEHFDRRHLETQQLIQKGIDTSINTYHNSGRQFCHGIECGRLFERAGRTILGASNIVIQEVLQWLAKM
jgi:hypothetical protein